MSFIEAENALIGAVQKITGRPEIYYPGGKNVSLPRWVIQPAGNVSRTPTFDGAAMASTAIMVRVETKSGKYAGENNDLVTLLLGAFPVNRRITMSNGGIISITTKPQVMPPLDGNGVFARPVIITGTFIF